MLKIVEKRYSGVTVGYVVGYWTFTRWYRSNQRLTFRSIREGLLFKTLEDARAWRDDLENRRAKSGIEYVEQH